MKAKGLDAFIDEVTRQADGTGVDAVIKAVLSPRQRGSSQPSERRIQEIKDKVSCTLQLNLSNKTFHAFGQP